MYMPSLEAATVLPLLRGDAQDRWIALPADTQFFGPHNQPHAVIPKLPALPCPPTRRASATAKRKGDKPLVLIRTVASRQMIVAASDTAADHGIRPGMTLAQARALCAGLAHAEHDPARDAKALEALARWMMRFTPVVALPAFLPLPQGEKTGGSIFLDLTGCERVFGGIENLLRQIQTSLARVQITAKFALAPTPGAAWALAYSDETPDGITVDSLQLLAALTPLPPEALRIDDSAAAALHHLGIATIGQLMALPRDALPARFGSSLLDRVDQALGRLAEPLVPLQPFTPVESKMDFDGVVESLEVIWIVFKELIGRVVPDLTRRGCGARRIDVEFLRPDGATPLRKTLQLSRPSRDPVNLFNLLRCATEKFETTERAAVQDGFLGVHLKVTVFERLDHEQIALLEHEQYTGERELERLVERLRIRLGAEAVVRPVLVESHTPELAWGGEEARGSRQKTRAQRTAHRDGASPPLPLAAHRPLHLLATPTEVGVMVSPSHDRDGRPILFNHQGQVHDVQHAVGPERICGQWWNSRNKTRDYFDVEDAIGRRYWLFRVLETGRWYLHGEFE